jgi:hypothetical protein
MGHGAIPLEVGDKSLGISNFPFRNPQFAFHKRRKTGILPSGLKHLKVNDVIGGYLLGGEVPPASPARYDLTKLGEAEIAE